MEPFELTANDKASSLWLRLRAHLDDRLAAARLRNDGALSDTKPRPCAAKSRPSSTSSRSGMTGLT